MRELCIACRLIFQTSAKDTLLVVTQICSEKDEKLEAPFVARGPNDRALKAAKTIWQLPLAIEKTIAGDREEDTERTSQQNRDVPITSRTPIEVSSEETTARKRVIGGKSAVEKLVR